MEIFIATDTASVQLFFNVFATGIETFVIPWDQRLNTCVAEVCRLGLEPLCDNQWPVAISAVFHSDAQHSSSHLWSGSRRGERPVCPRTPCTSLSAPTTSACTLFRPAENCLHQRRTICLLMTLGPLTRHSGR
jgi:hypothetical protein